jgi:CHAT domain-containing protein
MKKIFLSIITLHLCNNILVGYFFCAKVFGQEAQGRSQQTQSFWDLAEKQYANKEYIEAIKNYKIVVSIAQDPVTLNKEKEGLALQRIGLMYYQSNQNQEAVKYFQASLTIFRQLNNRDQEAETLYEMGWAYENISWSEALKYYTKSVMVFRERGNTFREIQALNNQGNALGLTGDLLNGLSIVQRSLVINRNSANKDATEEMKSLRIIGSIYAIQGKTENALKSLNEALADKKAVDLNPKEVCNIFNLIALLLHNKGEYAEAISYLKKSLSISEKNGYLTIQAGTYYSVALMSSNFGYLQESIDASNKCLEIAIKINNIDLQGSSHNLLAWTNGLLGKYNEAQNHAEKALILSEKVTNNLVKATIFSFSGAVIGKNDPIRREEYLMKAMQIFHDNNFLIGEHQTLTMLALLNAAKNPSLALNYAKRALSLVESKKLPLPEADAYVAAGMVYYKLGDFSNALDFLKKGNDLLQRIGSFDQVLSLSMIGLIYEKQNNFDKALPYLEKAFSSILLTRSGLIRDKEGDSRKSFSNNFQGIAGEVVSILVRQHKFEKAYEYLNLSVVTELADYSRLTNVKTSNINLQKEIDKWSQDNNRLAGMRVRSKIEISEHLLKQIRILETMLVRQSENIVAKYPEAAEIFESKPKDIKVLQSSIPDGVAVIHPVLTVRADNNSDLVTIFVFSNKSKVIAKQFEFPKVEIENLLAKTSNNLSNSLNPDYISDLKRLYDLLVLPVEKEIQEINPKQLSFIANGRLQYIPFEALYQCNDSKCSSGQHLIQKYPISYLTRISTNSLGSQSNKLSESKILAVGNPVPKKPQLLNGAESEAQSITNLFPGSQTLLREKATFEAFQTKAPRFNILHLATHGCFQKGGCKDIGLDENTILFADKQLKIADAALLGLKDIDLITLSACQTAKETDKDGQQLSGLAYIFERAGAKSVIATLWSVEDKVTSEIMLKFYQNLKLGMTKAEALQKAKLPYINEHPSLWAPFVLIGDPR